MAYICEKDWSIFHSENDDQFNAENCFEVDEVIALSVCELNKKGYATKFCCSGHIFSDATPWHNESGEIIGKMTMSNASGYISFKEKISLNTVPPGAVLEDLSKDDVTNLYFMYDSKDGTPELQSEITKMMVNLYEWTKSLDYMKYSVEVLNGETNNYTLTEVIKIYLHSEFMIIECDKFYYHVTFESYISDNDILMIKEEKYDEIEYLLNHKGRIMDEIIYKENIEEVEILKNGYAFMLSDLIYSNKEMVEFDINIGYIRY